MNVSYNTYCNLVDSIVEDGNIAKALIECSEEDALTAASKHVGIVMKSIISADVSDAETRERFMETLFHRYLDSPFTCKEQGYAAIDAITRACNFFVAIHTENKFYADPEFEKFNNPYEDDLK